MRGGVLVPVDTHTAAADNVINTPSPLVGASRAPRVPSLKPRTAAVYVSSLACLAALLVLLVLQPYRIDLDVYRIGAQAWLDGEALYGQLPATSAGLLLPFTYPPAAAVLFSPLALLPFWAANAVATSASVAALVVLLALSLRRSRAWRASAATVLVLVAASLLAEPIQATLGFGQVNLVLAALIALDVFATRTWWPRGVLIGVAAAVKLTPAVFILALLVRRQYREVATACIVFAGVTLLAWLIAPRDSERYWTDVLWDPGRIGGASYAGNQSIHGLLLRVGLSGATERVLWLACAGLVAMLAWRGMKAAERRGDVVLLLGLNGLVALLASPISWTHHWVWLIPICLAMWSYGREDGARWRALASLGAALMLVRPLWWLPRELDRELDWALWQHIAGDAYVLLGLAILVVAALPDRRCAGCAVPYRVRRPARRAVLAARTYRHARPNEA